MESFKSYLAKVATGASLTREEARDAFDDLLSGEVTPAQGGAFLMALRVRGEALDEIVGAVTAMRGRMLRVKAPEEVQGPTTRAATTSRRSPRSSSPPAAFQSPSTEIARRPRNPELRMCSRRSA